MKQLHTRLLHSLNKHESEQAVMRVVLVHMMESGLLGLQQLEHQERRHEVVLGERHRRPACGTLGPREQHPNLGSIQRQSQLVRVVAAASCSSVRSVSPHWQLVV